MLKKFMAAILACTMLATLMVSMSVSATEVSADEPNALQIITTEGKAAADITVNKAYMHATTSFEAEISGKKAVKTETVAGAQTEGTGKGLNVYLIGSKFIDAVKRGSYLEFDFYTDDASVLPYNIEMHTRDVNETAGGNNYLANKYYFPTNGVKAGVWNHIKIDLDNWYAGYEVDLYESLCQFNFLVPLNTEKAVTFYVTDMKITYPVNVASRMQIVTGRGDAETSYIKNLKAIDSNAEVSGNESIAEKHAVKTTVTAGKSSGLWLHFEQLQPAAPKSGDYLEFGFYAPDAKVLPSRIEVHTSSNDGEWLANRYYFPKIAMDTDGTVTDGWHHIKIDLDDCYKGYPLKDLNELYQIRIYLPDTATENTTFYVTNVAIVTYGDLGVEVVGGTESARPVIRWNNTYDSSLTRLESVDTKTKEYTYETGNYKVYRNGTEIGSVEIDADGTGYSFTDTKLPNPNQVQELTYEVKAVSYDGKTVKFADEGTLFYIPNQDNITSETKLITTEINSDYISRAIWSD